MGQLWKAALGCTRLELFRDNSGRPQALWQATGTLAGHRPQATGHRPQATDTLAGHRQMITPAGHRQMITLAGHRQMITPPSLHTY